MKWTPDIRDSKIASSGEWLYAMYLVPVEVFGAEDGYGLCDAVQAWSDCNRAIGQIYRVDDVDQEHRIPGETIKIYVTAEEGKRLRDTRWGTP